LPFSDRRYLVPVRRYSRSKREIRNFDVFGPPNFLGEGPPKFFTHIKKLQSPPNMWQSLVTIGPETSEIRRRKKSMIETSAVKYNGRRPASWRAAITRYRSSRAFINYWRTIYQTGGYKFTPMNGWNGTIGSRSAFQFITHPPYPLKHDD